MRIVILKSKAGVTLLEGVIALGLLALVMAGSFGVLLSTSRQTVQPDIYEEMVLAVEKANNLLKEYTYATVFDSAPLADTTLSDKVKKYQLKGTDTDKDYRKSICGTDNFYDLKCLLPTICDLNNDSDFSFTVVPLVGNNTPSFKTNWPTDLELTSWEGQGNMQMYQTGTVLQRDTTDYSNAANVPSLGIRYTIKCNGYEL